MVGKIKFVGQPSICITNVRDVTARAEGAAVEVTLDVIAPVRAENLVRLRSVLRVKALHDQVQAQAADLATWNRTLEQRATEQVAGSSASGV
jgi:hypothetical protein